MGKGIDMNVKCVILTGANALEIKTAFDLWREQWFPLGNKQRATVVSATMFGLTDLIVFYYVS